MPTPKQYIVTGFGARNRLRLMLFGLAAIAPTAALVLLPLAMDAGHWPDRPPWVDESPAAGVYREPTVSPDVRDDLMLGALVLSVLGSLVLPSVCLSMRQPRGGRLELDDWGVTELDGDDVRTAIAWEGAKVRGHEVISTRRGHRPRHGVDGIVLARSLSIASTAGHAIFVGYGRGVPHWARRRRTEADFDFSTPTRLGVDCRHPGLTTDPRDARRGMFGLSRGLGLVFLVLAGGAMNALAAGGTNARGAASMALMAAAVVAVLRALRPMGELRALAREAAPCASARPYQLVGRAGATRAKCSGDDGGGELELAGVTHPDARLAERETRVFAVVEAASGEAYRAGGGPRRVLAIETERDRTERRNLARANRLEIACRLVLAAGLMTVGVLLAIGWQEV